VPGCSFIHDKDKLTTLTAKEALKEGYAPCSRCLRKYLKTTNAAQARADLDADDAQDNEAQDKDVHNNNGHGNSEAQ
jgi:methylphosphotriester-DNA--protein-cysteine methyltransferase